jgi:hypothetical protein
LLSETDGAHLHAISDLDVAEDVIITGGKDNKVRLWIAAEILA